MRNTCNNTNVITQNCIVLNIDLKRAEIFEIKPRFCLEIKQLIL